MSHFVNYSLSEKRKYWLTELDKEFIKKKTTNKNSNRLKYATNFLISSKSGRLSNDFKSLDYSSQLGQLRGVRASCKNVRR